MALTKNVDLLPDSLVYEGDRTALDMDLSIITYDSSSAQMETLTDISQLLEYQDGSKISWINICGLKDIESLRKLGLLYQIHPLSIEDVLHTEQQPKAEVFGGYRFLSFKTIQQEKRFRHQQYKKRRIWKFGRNKSPQLEDVDEFLIDQISMIIMKNVLITIQEIPGDSFNEIRKRILTGMGEIRKMGTDYLAYAVLDAVVDEYFLTLNHLEEDIEDFENRAARTNDDNFLGEIQDTKRYLLKIRRAVTPLKSNLAIITRHEEFFQTDLLKPFIQDLNEHLSNAIATVEHYHEWLSNIMTVNLSVLSHQMNKVMKVLAIISTIFIPLTFIAGIYGMNFEFMPELEYALAYPLVLGGMGIIALGMIVIFKIRHWF